MTATSNFFNTNRANVKNPKPGYTQNALVAPRRWFDTLSGPAGNYGADKYTVTADHTFVDAADNKDPGGGFIQLYALPNTVQGPSSTGGETGALINVWKPQLFLPGDSPELQALVDALKNDDLIILIQDANDPTLPWLQFGCDGLEAHFTKAEFASGQTNTGKKGWQVEAESVARFTYSGTRTIMS